MTVRGHTTLIHIRRQQLRPMLIPTFLAAFLPMVGNVYGCQPLHRSGRPDASDPQTAITSNTTLTDYGDLARLLTEIVRDPAFQSEARLLAQMDLASYALLDQQATKPGEVGLPGRKLKLTPGTLTNLNRATDGAVKRRGGKSKSVAADMKASGINLAQISPDEVAKAWLSVAALVSADQSIATAVTPESQSSLGLTDVRQTARDLTTLARLGQKIYSSPSRALPAMLDIETWNALDRQRKLVDFTLNVAGRFKPDSRLVTIYGPVVRTVLKFSDAMAGLYEGEPFPNDQISIWE